MGKKMRCTDVSGGLHSEGQNWRPGLQSQQSNEEATDLLAGKHRGKQGSGEVLGASCMKESVRRGEALVYHHGGGWQTNQT